MELLQSLRAAQKILLVSIMVLAEIPQDPQDRIEALDLWVEVDLGVLGVRGEDGSDPLEEVDVVDEEVGGLGAVLGLEHGFQPADPAGGVLVLDGAGL